MGPSKIISLKMSSNHTYSCPPFRASFYKSSVLCKLTSCPEIILAAQFEAVSLLSVLPVVFCASVCMIQKNLFAYIHVSLEIQNKELLHCTFITRHPDVTFWTLTFEVTETIHAGSPIFTRVVCAFIYL